MDELELTSLRAKKTKYYVGGLLLTMLLVIPGAILVESGIKGVGLSVVMLGGLACMSSVGVGVVDTLLIYFRGYGIGEKRFVSGDTD